MSNEKPPAPPAVYRFRFDFACIPCAFRFYMLDPTNCAPECPQCGGPSELLSVAAK